MTWETCSGLDPTTCSICAEGEAICPLKAANTLNCFWNEINPCDQALPQAQCESIGNCDGPEELPACTFQTLYFDNSYCPRCDWNARQGINLTAPVIIGGQYQVPSKRRERRKLRRVEEQVGRAFGGILEKKNQRKIRRTEWVKKGKEQSGRVGKRIKVKKNEGAKEQERTQLETITFSVGRNLFGCSILYLPAIYKTGSIPYSECVAGGGVWISPSTDKQSCEAIMACREPLNTVCNLEISDGLSNKTQSECEACGGIYGQAFTWKGAQIAAATTLTAKWVTSAWSPLNFYIESFNQNLFVQQLGSLIYLEPGLSYASQIQCLTSPFLETLQPLACDCQVFANGTKASEGQCFPPTLSFPLGQQLFCRGDTKTVRLGNSVLSFLNTSIDLTSYCLSVNGSLVGASQFVSRTLVSSSGLLTSLTGTNNPYAVVKNSYGFVVGQLLSDGLILNMTEASFVNSSIVNLTSGGLLNVTRKRYSVEVNNYTICIDMRTDIGYDPTTYPLLDFVSTNDYVTWNPLCLNVTKSGNSYCASIETKSQVVFAGQIQFFFSLSPLISFPIIVFSLVLFLKIAALVSDWRSRDSIFDGNLAIMNALYFLSAAMFLLFVLSAGAVIYHLCKPKMTLVSVVSLSFLTVYAGLRAVFFLLFALSVLNTLSQNNPAGYFVVAELPYYVFLSIFVFVVILWVLVSKSIAFTQRRIFFLTLIFNLLLYIFFAVVCIVNAKVTGNGATVLNKVYKVIVAVIASTIVVLSWAKFFHS